MKLSERLPWSQTDPLVTRERTDYRRKRTQQALEFLKLDKRFQSYKSFSKELKNLHC